MIDETDRMICAILQGNARCSATEIAQRVGLSVSATNERIRRLSENGSLIGWHAALNPKLFDAALCAFVLIDMQYDGEAAAVAALKRHAEVQEIHHISGPHSYLVKLRLADTAALQRFLSEVIKPLAAVIRTESLIALDSPKETARLAVQGVGDV